MITTPQHDANVKRAKQILSALFSDTSVTPEVTLNSMLGLQEEIADYILALEYDIEVAGKEGSQKDE